MTRCTAADLPYHLLSATRSRSALWWPTRRASPSPRIPIRTSADSITLSGLLSLYDDAGVERAQRADRDHDRRGGPEPRHRHRGRRATLRETSEKPGTPDGADVPGEKPGRPTTSSSRTATGVAPRGRPSGGRPRRLGCCRSGRETPTRVSGRRGQRPDRPPPVRSLQVWGERHRDRNRQANRADRARDPEPGGTARRGHAARGDEHQSERDRHDEPLLR